MLTAKYIIYRHFRDDRALAVLFAPTTEHKSFDSNYNDGTLELIAAGMCFIGKDVVCSGESLSLGLKGRGEADAAIIRATFTV